MQVAAWWAAQRYEDFAAIVQPFFSGALAANVTLDFLSDVRENLVPSFLSHLYLLLLSPDSLTASTLL